MSKQKQRVKVDAAPAPMRQPLPGLAALRDKLPAAPAASASVAADEPVQPEPASSTSASAAPASTVFSRAPRLVVRRERKGHGGRTATRIEGLIGSTRELERAVGEIKRALGCGATLERGDVIVQGAQGDRLLAFLEERGARKIVVGS